MERLHRGVATDDLYDSVDYCGGGVDLAVGHTIATDVLQTRGSASRKMCHDGECFRNFLGRRSIIKGEEGSVEVHIDSR